MRREEVETLGQRLRRLREAAGLSSDELAARAGVPLVSYRNWEYDHRVPGLGAASRMAKALGEPLQVLADCVEGVGDGRNQARKERGGRQVGEKGGPAKRKRGQAARRGRRQGGRAGTAQAARRDGGRLCPPYRPPVPASFELHCSRVKHSSHL